MLRANCGVSEARTKDPAASCSKKEGSVEGERRLTGESCRQKEEGSVEGESVRSK